MGKAEGSRVKYWQAKKLDFDQSGMVDSGSITGCTWHFRMWVFSFAFTCRDNLAVNYSGWIVPIRCRITRYGIPRLLRPLG